MNERRRIIRLRGLLEKLACSQSTFHRRYRQLADFPKPLALPDGKLGWWESEIDAWLERLPRAEIQGTDQAA